MQNTLIKLATIFKENNSTLFVVGGAVRDMLLGKKAFDYDICSNLRLEKVLEILSNTSFLVKVKNPILETAIITYQNFNFEYATLREETYLEQGERCPISVNFVSNIKEDYLRRDFTCNALYLDILTNKIIDNCNGKADIKNKILKTVREPNQTFCEDSLRILRLIRFSLELGFQIDEETKNQAIQNSYLLLNLKGGAKLTEIERILKFGTNEKNYKEKNKQKLSLLQDLKVLSYIFSNKLKRIDFNEKIENIFNFSLNCNNEKYALLCFLLDIYLYSKNKTRLSPNELIDNILGSLGLQVSKKIQKDFINFIKAYEFDKKQENIRFFIYINLKNIEFILDILSFSTKKFDLDIEKATTLQYNKIKANKIPLSPKELKITANELLTKYPQTEKVKFKKILDKMFYLVFFEKLENKKLVLMQFFENEIKI